MNKSRAEKGLSNSRKDKMCQRRKEVKLRVSAWMRGFLASIHVVGNCAVETQRMLERFQVVLDAARRFWKAVDTSEKI